MSCFLISSTPPFEWLRFRLLGSAIALPLPPSLTRMDEGKLLLFPLISRRAEPHKEAQGRGVHHA